MYAFGLGSWHGAMNMNMNVDNSSSLDVLSEAEQIHTHTHVLQTSLPRSNLSPLLFLVMILTATLITAARNNYLAWRALGPGGVPYNVRGWLEQSLLRLRVRPSRTTECYACANTLKAHGGLESTACKSWLDVQLGQRQGTRPEVANFVVPQRQIGQGGTSKIRQMQEKLLSDVVGANSGLVECGTSVLERHGPAIFVATHLKAEPWAKRMRREIAHVHLSDPGSMHVILSLPDAKEVVEKGWGERHGLSGVCLPLGFTLLYAPRNRDELQILGSILQASIKSMTRDSHSIEPRSLGETAHT